MSEESLARALSRAFDEIDKLQKRLRMQESGCRHWRPGIGCVRWADNLLEELEEYADVPVVEEDIVCVMEECPEVPVPYGVRISSMWLCPEHARQFAFKLLSKANQAERLAKRAQKTDSRRGRNARSDGHADASSKAGNDHV